jgi:hypothetical protein
MMPTQKRILKRTIKSPLCDGLVLAAAILRAPLWVAARIAGRMAFGDDLFLACSALRLDGPPRHVPQNQRADCVGR